MLVRIDGVSDILPVIPYVGLLLAGRRPQALPLLAGTAAGAAYGLVNAVVLSRPYVLSISGSLLPLAAVAAVALAGTAVGVVVLRRRRLPDLRGTWLPAAAAALVVVIMIGFAVRPYVQTVHGQATQLATRVMAGYQRADHLPVDPTRLYYEISLHWVFWYIGLPAVVLGTLGAALLARRCLSGEAPAWTLPLLAFGWIIVVTLARPGITPDQPWASRRLVPGVLPGFLLLAVWAVAWLLDWLRRTGREPVIRRSAAVLAAAALLVPAAVTTFGLSFSGVNGLGTKTTYSGEIAAVDQLCASVPADASVVVVNYATASRFLQLIRGMCGVPAARLFLPAPASVQATVAGIRHAGRRPVLLAAKQAQLTPFGGPVRQVMTLHSTADAHPLTGPPTGTSPLNLTVWMSGRRPDLRGGTYPARSERSAPAQAMPRSAPYAHQQHRNTDWHWRAWIVADNVVISHRGAAYEIGRGRGFYGIWPAGAPRSQPAEWWPATPAGWSGAWSRFTRLEAPAAIVPVTAAPILKISASTRAIIAAVLLAVGVVFGAGSLFPGYIGHPSLASSAGELVPHLIYLATWLASTALILRGGTRLRVGALLAAGTSVVTLGLFFADLATAIAGSNLVGAGLVLGLIGWLSCAAGAATAVWIRPEAPGAAHSLPAAAGPLAPGRRGRRDRRGRDLRARLGQLHDPHRQRPVADPDRGERLRHAGRGDRRGRHGHDRARRRGRRRGAAASGPPGRRPAHRRDHPDGGPGHLGRHPDPGAGHARPVRHQPGPGGAGRHHHQLRGHRGVLDLLHLRRRRPGHGRAHDPAEQAAGRDPGSAAVVPGCGARARLRPAGWSRWLRRAVRCRPGRRDWVARRRHHRHCGARRRGAWRRGPLDRRGGRRWIGVGRGPGGGQPAAGYGRARPARRRPIRSTERPGPGRRGPYRPAAARPVIGSRETSAGGGLGADQHRGDAHGHQDHR